jgi:hypothetical protein
LPVLDVNIPLGRADVPVSERAIHNEQIARSSVEKRRKSVPEGMNRKRPSTRTGSKRSNTDGTVCIDRDLLRVREPTAGAMSKAALRHGAAERQTVLSDHCLLRPDDVVLPEKLKRRLGFPRFRETAIPRS